ncbi:unnamed protein product [Camellia sinensis]
MVCANRNSQLCKHPVSRNYKISLVIDSDISSPLLTSLLQSLLFEIANITSSPPQPNPFHHQEQHMLSSLNGLLTRKTESVDLIRPICAIIDHIQFKTQQVFGRFGVPTVTFITSGACWATMQHAVWRAQPNDMKPDEVQLLSDYPKRYYLSIQILSNAVIGWVFHSMDMVRMEVGHKDLGVHLFRVNRLDGWPNLGVGPLLPDGYWRSTDSILRDQEIRPKRDSNYTEDQTIEWLDSKPRGSVFYVSFGSEVGPSMEEYPKLANASEESKWPFTWVIQKPSGRPGPPFVGQPGPGSLTSDEGYFPHGLDNRVSERGLIIHGWAPQLLILSHQSTGGFLSHCGWNSTVEAIG